jgi:AcrR family transcriptional regulator
MAKRVKESRPYNSPRRRQQADATRRAILEAAERLFLRDGYAGTTMAAIAAEADVALKTVYVAFETKAGVLRALWHLRLRGDQEDVPVGRRPWFVEVLDESDPRRALQIAARASKEIKQRGGALMETMRTAAPSDPDIGELWARIETDFHAHQRKIVDSLHARKALKKGLAPARAADVLWTLNHPALYALLVGTRGWTPDEYETWLADAFRNQLLAPP